MRNARPDPGAVYQATVPAGCWFGASLQAEDYYALAGCTLAPGFEPADFELADRTRLLAAFPEHRETIRLLT